MEESINFDEQIKARPFVWVFSCCIAVAIGVFTLMQYVNLAQNEALNQRIEYLKPFEGKYIELQKENEEIKRENSSLKDDNKLLKNTLKDTQLKLEESNTSLEELTNKNKVINEEYKKLKNNYNSIQNNSKLIKNRPKTKNDLIEEQIEKLESQKKKCSTLWVEQPIDVKETHIDSCQENNQKIDQKIIELIKSIN